jgi:hypothetical protein
MSRLFFVTVITAVITACASSSPSPEKTSSGFLTQRYYDQLTQVKTPSDQIVSRYVSPSFDPSRYKQAIVEPVIAYPKPQPTEQVSMETLETLELQLTMLLEDDLSEVLALTRTPGPDVLRLELAVTGINISDKPLKGYQYIPIALIAAEARGREQQVKLFLEGRVTDSVTGEVQAVSTRELTGEDLKNAKSKLEAKQLNQGIEAAGKDWLATFKSFFSK